MVSTDVTNLKSIDAPQSSDHVSFRDWIRVEVLWSNIEKCRLELYISTIDIHKHIRPGESFEVFMEVAKQVHRKDAFNNELGIMKSKGKQDVSDAKKILAMVGHRCVCRWLLRVGLAARLAPKLFAVLDPMQVQLGRNFNKPIYKSLPWFLEYAEGKFAPKDELRHNSAVSERTKRMNRQAIVLHVPLIAPPAESRSSMPAGSTTVVAENVEAGTQSSRHRDQQEERTTINIGKKQKASKMTPTVPEIAEFSNSLEEQIETSSNVMLKYAGKGFDGGSINIGHFDISLDNKIIIENIISLVDKNCQHVSRITFRDQQWVNALVAAAFIFLPTNWEIYGIQSGGVPLWNQMEILEFQRLASITHQIVEDSGIFVVICTANQHEMVCTMAGAAGWAEDHVSMAICKVPVYKDANMTRHSLVISVWKKIEAPVGGDIPQPKEDTWFDTHVEEEWTMKDGQPLRGGLERGHCFLYQMLKVYTKMNDVVVQYGGDNGVFALVGRKMGRFMLVLEKDESFCGELPQILKAEAEKLNNCKAVEETPDAD